MSQGSELLPLLNVGAIGVVVWWFMSRNEKKLERFADAMLQVALQLARLQMALPNVPDWLRQQAQESVTALEGQLGKKGNGHGHGGAE